MITEEQKDLLKQYKEKAFTSSVLAEESYNYYNFVKNLINIPLIICNTAMVCINGSVEDQNTLKDIEYNFKFFNWSYVILYK